MRLIADDFKEVYVWVDDDNDNIVLSPHLDYEEDAIQWYGRISQDIFEEYGLKENNAKS